MHHWLNPYWYQLIRWAPAPPTLAALSAGYMLEIPHLRSLADIFPVKACQFILGLLAIVLLVRGMNKDYRAHVRGLAVCKIANPNYDLATAARKSIFGHYSTRYIATFTLSALLLLRSLN